MKRCPLCLTRFTLEELRHHMNVHATLNQVSRQNAFESVHVIAPARHNINEPCNCPFFGPRFYCEAVHLEAA